MAGVSSRFSRQFLSTLGDWWCEQRRDKNFAGASSLLVQHLWRFLLESTPEQRRQRYGDMEYDWENRVNTTSGTTGWRTRLLGMFHSPYQPTDAALFREMMASLPIDFSQFIFVDVGSGKGRTLLMASEYPFKRILGVELFEELHSVAQQNIRDYHAPTQVCMQIESILGNARDFDFPAEPLVLYLFNPLPEAPLTTMLKRLMDSLARVPRPVWIVYHNPLLERVLSATDFVEKTSGTEQYSIYRTIGPVERES